MNRKKLLGVVIIGSLALALIAATFAGDSYARRSWYGGRYGPAWGSPWGPLNPGFETGNIVYTVCKLFDPEKNCNKCSDYFTVRSQDEAESKCDRGGYDDVYYFPSVSRVYSWMGGNCTCDNDEEPY